MVRDRHDHRREIRHREFYQTGWRSMKAVVIALLPPALFAASASAQDGFMLGSADGPFHLNVRPSFESIMWLADTPAPALLDLSDDAFFAPRFSLAVDASAGDHWFLHATARWDRGFDAGDRPDGEVRLDELMLRWRPFDDQRLNFQAGKFPTVFGAWPGQHDFFDDPFMIAPLPYSQIIGIQTRNPAALSPAAISARAAGLAPPVSALAKDQWASILWGPDYATGASVFGASERFDYALEIKNSALSAHPDTWPDLDFNHPTLTTRIGYRPDAAWSFGVSASRGPYLEEQATPLLPAGTDRGDLEQTSVGLDARWAHHNWIISGEFVFSEFETLAAGDLRTAACYLQARWKVRPGIWLAARYGQLFANDATGAGGSDVSWQPDVRRAELAAGWRPNPRLLLKAHYSYTNTSGDPNAGDHLFGAGVGWRF
jgi:hypothetical protein